ncbi:MAG: leucyl/phenylalanyl-tRNA--protein transferase [Anaerolineales bacterium]
MNVPLLPIEVRTVAAPQPVPPSPYAFAEMEPDAEGLVGHGADFEPATVIAAYRAGCFPWPHPSFERLWFSPDPRAILPVAGLHVSRRLARTLRRGGFRITVDAAFPAVMSACARGRPEGTWITPGLEHGYVRLHELGWAHSVEAWGPDGTLAGGLYGIRVGRMFGAESMFHAVRDGSKVALAGFVQWCRDEGIELVDIQVLTPHTASLGGIEIRREEYLRRLAAATAVP